MADANDIHEILKGYMKIVAKAGGAVPLDPLLVKEFNTLGKSPTDEKSSKRLQGLLLKQIAALKIAKNPAAAAELELCNQAVKLVGSGGQKVTAVLEKIKPDTGKTDGKPAKLHGTGNQIVEISKPLPFKPEAEQGDLSLRSLFIKMATNPDLSMKAIDKDARDEDKKQMEDDRAQWGVARLTGKINFPEDNIKEFKAAAPSSIWLGFVRIGRRVDRPEDRLVLVQLSPEEEPGRKYLTKPQALVVGQTWHNSWLNRQFAAKPDPAIKSWNGWTLQDLKADKKIEISDTGCFFGFFLIKAKQGGCDHYWNFRCASLNKPANAQVSANVPDLPLGKMNPDQRSMYQNLITAARGNHEVPVSEIMEHFPKVKLHRATLGQKDASKKMPLSWAKAVFETVGKFSK